MEKTLYNMVNMTNQNTARVERNQHFEAIKPPLSPERAKIVSEGVKLAFDSRILSKANDIGVGDTIERVAADGTRETWLIKDAGRIDDLILQKYDSTTGELAGPLETVTDRNLARELVAQEYATEFTLDWDTAVTRALQDIPEEDHAGIEAIRPEALDAAGKAYVDGLADGEQIDRVALLRTKITEEVLANKVAKQRAHDAQKADRERIKLADSEIVDPLRLEQIPKDEKNAVYRAPEAVEALHTDTPWFEGESKLAERYAERTGMSLGETSEQRSDLKDTFFKTDEEFTAYQEALETPTANFLVISEGITNDREGFIRQFESLRKAGYLKKTNGHDVTIEDLMNAKNPIPFAWLFNKDRFNESTTGYIALIKKAIKAGG